MNAQSDRLEELLNEAAEIMAARNPGCALVRIQALGPAGGLFELLDTYPAVTASSSAAPEAVL